MLGIISENNNKWIQGTDTNKYKVQNQMIEGSFRLTCLYNMCIPTGDKWIKLSALMYLTGQPHIYFCPFLKELKHSIGLWEKKKVGLY